MQGCAHSPPVSNGSVYPPRNPRSSALHQCAVRHAPELKSGGRYARRVEQNVIERFLECGDPHHGFARLRCGQCGLGCILPFSCKARNFCPSCHQKRVLAYGEWVESEILAPVPHRQYVFTVPRVLRPIFSRKRGLLGKLCNIIERLLARAYASARPGGRPGMILFVQTFGDLVTYGCVQNGAAAKKPLVLVIEDDDQIALFIRHDLERGGYEVRVAADGKEAAALIGHIEPPRVVTLDIDLPHASGDELMLRIKTTPGWERVPVIMVTATPNTEDSTWAVKKGAKAYLVKPFKPDELIESVRRLTAPKKPAS